jgi:hypothetical protein
VGDESLEPVYKATEFWVEDAPGGPFHLRCGEQSLALDWLLEEHGLDAWAYITACNPGSQRLTDEENARRMEVLEVRLRQLPCVIFHGRGVGTRGDWAPEPSLLALGLSELVAREIATSFGQKAIVVGRRGKVARLIWLESEQWDAATGPALS